MNNCKINAIFPSTQLTGSAPEAFNEFNAESALSFHESLPNYTPTQLVPLTSLAKSLGIKNIYVKDESTRFNLKAFKGLGGTYAMYKILCDKLKVDAKNINYTFFNAPNIKSKISDVTFVTATDGNHGKGVSWATGLFGCQSIVFMPKGSSEKRAQAIRDVGPAKVEITDKNYDETVAYAKKISEENGWVLIQDTAWDGYEEIPTWIIQGYLTMAKEATSELDNLGIKPTHVFLQAGVGAMAGGICGFLVNHYSNPPKISIVEPETVACVFLSAECNDGKAHSIEGDPVTIMAGLNCGTPCKTTWPILRDFSTSYFACSDYISADGMRIYANPINDDPKIISGESGAVTLGLVTNLLKNEEFKDMKSKLDLNEDSIILLFNTESDTDPEVYNKIITNQIYND